MPKIIIATGGTGGHIFPAQYLAEELIQRGVEVLFVGGGLDTNRYFRKDRFPHRSITSHSLRGWGLFRGILDIFRGIRECRRILEEEKPDLVIGFGSFYVFPVLVATRLKGIPYVLFEPNAVPGKVNRLFSKKALFTAVQFFSASKKLKGNSVEVQMPTAKVEKADIARAREYFYLDAHRPTILVFGGSQGAEAINNLMAEAVVLFPPGEVPFQIIHITGKTDRAQNLRSHYEELGLKSCVKAFEEKMSLAWSAADLVICRSGAATVAEQIAYGIPALFIPFPKAADDHQTYNARFVEEAVQGGRVFAQHLLTPEKLKNELEILLDPILQQKMRTALAVSQQGPQKPDLFNIILDLLRN
ncbi:MAG: undecaprenyldiphospho-muramoylpentapeptide beta-N-acetylglucosaminyltransferase [Verrucomicrobia bacterium]|nr:undecaprenyldiphospho-muramoylpentapeptide beta-N-acetylglucosaminyltransferase [Verrucomicrobiota bacterium]